MVPERARLHDVSIHQLTSKNETEPRVPAEGAVFEGDTTKCTRSHSDKERITVAQKRNPQLQKTVIPANPTICNESQRVFSLTTDAVVYPQVTHHCRCRLSTLRYIQSSRHWLQTTANRRYQEQSWSMLAGKSPEQLHQKRPINCSNNTRSS